MDSADNKIILVIEDTPVTCNKEELISSSDYFKVMFQGDFVEKNQSKIKLKDVDLKAMNIILTLLWDESQIIPDEDILLVLQTACMLQFVKIRNICIERITEMLCPKTCIKIWRITEQLDIKPLFLKAKTMALDEFLEIKDSNCILEFSLEEIYRYLGHINLKTDNELTVFQTAMRWWYENIVQYVEKSTNVLIKLLSCIDFKNLSIDYLNDIIIYPDVADNLEITQILLCILLLKNNQPVDHIPEMYQQKAHSLLKSKSRKSSSFPCILVNYVQDGKHKKFKTSEEQKHKVVFYDVFKRKRLYENVENDYKSDMLTIVYYDYSARRFKKFFDIAGTKCTGLDGFKLVGHKEFIFLYGGEFLIGKGNWNPNFWVYNTINERWQRKCLFPSCRRHFESTMVNDMLYIVGGTGSFRVIKDNMFWYNYKDNLWHYQVLLPCSGRQLKCCSFLNQLFILSVNNKRGYFFDNKSQWVEMDVIINDSLIRNEAEFVIFSYKDKLYLKGKNLIEFELVQKKLIVVSVKEVSNIICDKMELVLCDNIAYSFYKHRCDDNYVYSLETYDLDTGETDFVFKEISSDDPVIEINNDKYTINPNLKILSFQHCTLAEKDNLVNDCFA